MSGPKYTASVPYEFSPTGGVTYTTVARTGIPSPGAPVLGPYVALNPVPIRKAKKATSLRAQLESPRLRLSLPLSPSTRCQTRAGSRMAPPPFSFSLTVHPAPNKGRFQGGCPPPPHP